MRRAWARQQTSRECNNGHLKPPGHGRIRRSSPSSPGRPSPKGSEGTTHPFSCAPDAGQDCAVIRSDPLGSRVNYYRREYGKSPEEAVRTADERGSAEYLDEICFEEPPR